MKDLFEFAEAVGEGTWIALCSAEDLVSDSSSSWHDIGLNVVNPGVNLSGLACISSVGELSIITG